MYFNNDYFSAILSFNEDANTVPTMNDAGPEPENIEQDDATMAGASVDNMDATQEEMPPEDGMEDPAADPNDPFGMGEAQPEVEVDIPEVTRKLKIFDMFISLKKQATSFMDIIDRIDMNSIRSVDATAIYGGFDAMTTKITRIKEKISFFLINQFNDTDYDKCLYLYVSLRNELVEIVRLFRTILAKEKI